MEYYFHNIEEGKYFHNRVHKILLKIVESHIQWK